VSPDFTILARVISPDAAAIENVGDNLTLFENFFMLYVSLIQPVEIMISIRIKMKMGFLFIVGLFCG
jgi:hypothetical protein